MAKAVLVTKVDPTYDDLPEERYHFPRTYLRQVEAALGDWIVYYEPRRSTGDLSSRGGRQAYFAMHRLFELKKIQRAQTTITPSLLAIWNSIIQCHSVKVAIITRHTPARGRRHEQRGLRARCPNDPGS